MMQPSRKLSVQEDSRANENWRQDCVMNLASRSPNETTRNSELSKEKNSKANVSNVKGCKGSVNKKPVSRSYNYFLDRNLQENWRYSSQQHASFAPLRLERSSQSINTNLERRQGAIRKYRSQSISSDRAHNGTPFTISQRNVGNQFSQMTTDNKNSHLAKFTGNGSQETGASTKTRGRKLYHSLDRKPEYFRSLLGGGMNSTENINSEHKMNKRKALNKIPRRMEWITEYADKTASDIVAKIANSHSGFETIVKDIQLLKEIPNVLIMIVKMLAKVGDADFEENKISVLAKVCSYEFLEQLSSFTNFLPTEKTNIEHFDVNDFLQDVLLFSKSVTILLPSTAMERFGKLLFAVNACIMGMEDYRQIVIRDDVKQLYQSIKSLLDTTSQNKDNKVKVTSTSELLSFQAPPNNFRDINLIPTVDDIFADEVAFVRPNLIQGAYVNIEHYLDVQFRLLHEDFIRPMREGIVEYVEKSARQNVRRIRRVTNVRLYNKVIFLTPKVISDRIGIIINFDPDRHLKKVNWRSSKRFMYGSLLCFTQDNFRSIMFGTVVETNEKDLHQGLVVVELCTGSQIRDDLFRAQFTMAESEVYFEPYYQVLKALKEMKEEEFPMKRYIVDAECDGKPPAYLLTDSDSLAECSVDSDDSLDELFVDSEFTLPVLTPATDSLAVYTVDSKFTFPVLTPASWPSAEQLGLDDSQYRAFKFALTKEFVVIQGPPGTGKTFLGLKVARVLLENHKVWNADRKPILVVCYTNHALDQFLEGLLTHTKKIVRAGSQSKSLILEAFNLKNLRRVYKKGNPCWVKAEDDKSEQDYVQMLRHRFTSRNDLGRDIREKMEASMLHIKRIQCDLEMIGKNEGIISLKDLHEQGVVSPLCYAQFPGDTETKEKIFVEWLLSQSEYAHCMQNDQKELEQIEDEDIDTEDYVAEDTRERITRDVREDYGLEVKDVKSRLTYAISINSLKMLQYEITKAKKDLWKIRNENEMLFHTQISYFEYMLDDAVYKTERLEQRLRKMKVMNKVDVQHMKNQLDLKKLNFDDRWMLYRYWISLLKEKLLEEFKQMEEIFNSDAKKYEEARYMIDLEIMKNSHVIGMTTTYAARYQTLLKALKPKIVIVEEAAEVLESHIIVSLTSHCQHLILIGDHQQLRPSTSVYDLAKKFCLDVSLFERMLNNSMHCEILQVQHRMRPEIASLIVPSIYPVLHNHKDVTLFDQIQGVTKNLFFIDHTFPEEEVGDNFSRRNVHEAEFLISLCRHLILQGYSPNTITILSTYTAQMFYMKNESKKYDLMRDVRITVVDNFQGEENDIILLSLVRSNEEDNIGFLKIENRVCVALSRARKGLYIMGNMKNLLGGSEIWPKINSTLDQLKSIGRSLELQCKVHSDQRRLVSKAEDFTDIMEGGCKLLCGSMLSCGHICQSVCHASDREHSNYRCPVKPCDRVVCILGHKCKNTCFEDCGPCLVPVKRELPCGHELELQCYINYEKIHCQVIVKKQLPDCKHYAEMYCSGDAAVFPCIEPCDARLEDCGHTCRRKCHVTKDPDHLEYQCMQQCPRKNADCSQNHPCTKKCYEECGLCEVRISKVLPNCNHKAEMACSQDPYTFECTKKCEKIMTCGHKCKRKCSEECTGCNVLVSKSIPGCEHKINLRCCMPAQKEMCEKQCEKILDCGHKCTALCGEDCIKNCKEFVKSEVKAECGHEVKIPCYKKKMALPMNSEELLSYCKAKCGAELQCGHFCPGTCSECFQGRLHVSCQQNCGRTLICGHACNTPCAVTCPPCRQKCAMRCYHNKCKKTCGQPCTPCWERCGWNCKHFRCTRKCFEPCNRPPCSEPCTKTIMKCGHPCIGFCGEPCPHLCLLCDKDEVRTVVFGNEDEEDARFVLLEDCKHVIEHRDLERWLIADDGAITMAVCPKCKTPISRNLRYSNIIKQRYAAVCEVKQIVFGERNRIDQRRNYHFQKLQEIRRVYSNEPVQHTTRRPIIRYGADRIHQASASNSTTSRILTESVHFGWTMEMLTDSLAFKNKKNRRNVVCDMDMETLGIKTEILCQMGMKIKNHQNSFTSDAKNLVLKYMDVILEVIRYRNKILSNQEVTDLNLEMQRFHRIVDLCELESKLKLSSTYSAYKTMLEEQLRKPLLSIAKYSMELDESLKKVQGKLGAMVEEREQIVKAVGMKPGHWYKCPNGHFYVIGECGGASQIGRCNECGSQIGGTGHRLLSDNQHAPEMDGSRCSAWSDAANMANYVFDWNRFW